MDDISVERFWSKVDKNGPIPDPEKYPLLETRCWRWVAGFSSNGYGACYVRRGGKKGQYLSHRMSWIIANGEIPDGLWVLHKCDNKSCVNPEHLFLGDVDINSRDMRDKGRGKNPPVQRGTDIALAKMNDWIVRIIRRLNQGGMTYADCGRLFGVSNVAARLAILRQTWRHVL